MTPDWLDLRRGDAPLVVSFPHAGTVIPPRIEAQLASAWLARKDADWWIDELYASARELGATTIATRISRTVIDVNRDPSGASLYPGQATTELCPTTTFDGEPLYRGGRTPDEAEILRRRARWFDPYHACLAAELGRLREKFGTVVLYDAHAIRSRIPRLFDGELPALNLGASGGASCAPVLRARLAEICAASGFSHVVDGRFRGGWTTRHYGRPDEGVHAVQMELACRGYMEDPPDPPREAAWPTPLDPVRAAPLRAVLDDLLAACLDFVKAAA